jgi:hypothetical protein
MTIHQCMDAVFQKLSLVYGRDFTARYEGLDMRDVKEDWAFELSGFEKNPSAFGYALRNLPISKPPNVFEFRVILLRAPAAPAPRLEAPRGNPEVAHKAIAEARALLTRMRT